MSQEKKPIPDTKEELDEDQLEAVVGGASRKLVGVTKWPGALTTEIGYPATDGTAKDAS